MLDGPLGRAGLGVLHVGMHVARKGGEVGSLGLLSKYRVLTKIKCSIVFHRPESPCRIILYGVPAQDG